MPRPRKFKIDAPATCETRDGVRIYALTVQQIVHPTDECRNRLVLHADSWLRIDGILDEDLPNGPALLVHEEQPAPPNLREVGVVRRPWTGTLLVHLSEVDARSPSAWTHTAKENRR